ncbi:MAG: hypothetical protein QM784_04625 [Polyangiaceae bacterium]
MTTEQKPAEVRDYERPIVAELCRFAWIAFGPASLFFAAAAIWQMPPWTHSYRDYVFGIALLVTVLSRFFDIRFFHGSTTENQPATMTDFYRYAIKLVVIAVVMWGLAQSLQA